MAQRKFIHVDQLPIAVAEFLQESGFVGIQLQTDGPCVMRCDVVSESAAQKILERYHGFGNSDDILKKELEGSC